MRSTLTIEDDIAQALRELARERGCSYKAVVNEVLRRGLTTGDKPDPHRKPFQVKSAPRGFYPGIDPLKLNQLNDELETERFLAGNHVAIRKT